jgi:hypothetical protein
MLGFYHPPLDMSAKKKNNLTMRSQQTLADFREIKKRRKEGQPIIEQPSNSGS